MTGTLTSTLSRLAEDVHRGLSRPGRKTLPSEYLYDDIGSILFEAITQLPEYGLTRADRRQIAKLAPELPGMLPGIGTVAELGSGSGSKTARILDALPDTVRYYPIDVSATALDLCVKELAGLACIRPLRCSYLDGLGEVAQGRTGRMLVLFLGSTIGNFGFEESLQFLRELRGRMKRNDALLLGADLIKPAPMLLDAYDDPTGVTAAFNKNLLARLNRELGGEFVLRQFEHVAVYDQAEHRVEMHLESLCYQSVQIRDLGLNVTFEQGETIWTESSSKYDLAQLPVMAEKAGFTPRAQWIDDVWPFAENLWIAR